MESFDHATSEPSGGCPVNSWNEWDPLEEVIVGRLEGATIPTRHPVVTFNVPRMVGRIFSLVGGLKYPPLLTRPAQAELDEFIRVLEGEGVRVRRPDVIDWSKKFRTRFWRSRGFCVACPRDGFLVLGDEIIETPMAWRTRFFEYHAYRRLFKEYFRGGARWTSAPKPELLDEAYDPSYTMPGPGEPLRYVISEFEPLFDAADFVRCGRHLIGHKSNVTNEAGFEWLRRHVGDRFEIVEIETECRQPMHIDSSFMPLAPGKVLVNPDFIDTKKLPEIFKTWDVLVAPQPDPIPGWILSMCSEWIAMNVLMLDTERVIVEASQTRMIDALRDWGFRPIPVPFLNFAPFGGSFHCATLDVRRTGHLQSYF